MPANNGVWEDAGAYHIKRITIKYQNLSIGVIYNFTWVKKKMAYLQCRFGLQRCNPSGRNFSDSVFNGQYLLRYS